MAFADKQGSQYGGKPIRLYEFRIGRYPTATSVGQIGYSEPLMHGDAVYRMNDSENSVTVSARVWPSLNVSDNGFRFSGQATADGYEVTLPADHVLARKFRGTPPSQTIALTVYDVHATDGALQAQVVWVGEVAQCRRPSVEKAVFQCVTIAAAFQRTGLRLAWEKNCPHMVYDSQCKLNIRDHSVARTITEIVSGTQIRLDSALDDSYLGGIISWTTAEQYSDSLGISAVAGMLVTVFGLTDKLIGITAVSCAKGCARTIAACTAFDNLNNYGGAPHMPERNPFDGQPLF